MPSQVLRNGDLHRATLGAVGTARAGDGDPAVDDAGHLLHQGDLVSVKFTVAFQQIGDRHAGCSFLFWDEFHALKVLSTKVS